MEVRHLLSTVNHGDSIFILWGYMAYKQKYGQIQNLRILKENLKEYAIKLGLSEDFYF